jgi:hypothetical protein
VLPQSPHFSKLNQNKKLAILLNPIPSHLTDFIITALIYHVSLSSRKHFTTRPYALIFFEIERKNKGIRARWVDLLATKGNLINKGCMLEAARKEMLSNAELLGLGN